MLATLKAILPPPILRLLQRAWWRVHIAQDWWGTKVWTGSTEALTPFGFRLSTGYHPAYKQMRDGSFEAAETALLERLLPRVDVFIDVGANLGYYTLLARHHGKHVVAFEPQPQNVQLLTRNLSDNRWADGAEVFPMGLSERHGVLTLYGASGPSASLVKGWASYSTKHQQNIPVTTLDIVLGHRFNGQSVIVKIDVEGGELGVLRGALRTLATARNSFWLVEICLNEFHPSGSNPDFQEIFDLFWDHGYSAYVASTTPIAVSPEDVVRWRAGGRTDTGVFNYLFVGPEAAL